MDRRLYQHPHRQFARGAPVTVQFDGDSYRAYEGEPVAVALHAAGVQVLSRSLKYHRPRAAFCLSGHCSGCLVRADELPSVRSCQLAAREGLVCEGQNVIGSSELDVLAAVDWLFPKGMDHHTLMTGSRLLHGAMQKMVRQLSGLGKLPAGPVGALLAPEIRTPDVVVVGGGPAGLTAATACAARGLDTLLVDEQVELGGSWLADPRAAGGPPAASRAAAAARAAGVDLRSQATCLSWFPEDDGGVLAVATPERLVRVRARAYVYATGGYEVNAPFADNDRPGVLAARGAARLLVRWGVAPGDRLCVLGDGDDARALLDEAKVAGVATVHVDGARQQAVRTRGGTWVDGLDVRDAHGRESRVDCDAIAVVQPPTPASEAPRQHGARVVLDPARGGFAVVIDAHGATTVPGVWAAGDVTGAMGPAAAAAHGARVGDAVARAMTG